MRVFGVKRDLQSRWGSGTITAIPTRHDVDSVIAIFASLGGWLRTAAIILPKKRSTFCSMENDQTSHI